MNRRSWPQHALLVFFLFLVTAFILSGCALFKVDRKEAVLSESSWSLSRGLVLVQSNLELVPRTVKWSGGTNSYEAKGLGLQVNARIRVTHDTLLGDNVVAVHLPGLAALASFLNATPVFPNEGEFVPPDKVQVQVIRVHDLVLKKLTTYDLQHAGSIVFWIFLLGTYPLGTTGLWVRKGVETRKALRRIKREAKSQSLGVNRRWYETNRKATWHILGPILIWLVLYGAIFFIMPRLVFLFSLLGLTIPVLGYHGHRFWIKADE